jgi:hypothetical protein
MLLLLGLLGPRDGVRTVCWPPRQEATGTEGPEALVRIVATDPPDS